MGLSQGEIIKTFRGFLRLVGKKRRGTEGGGKTIWWGGTEKKAKKRFNSKIKKPNPLVVGVQKGRKKGHRKE